MRGGEEVTFGTSGLDRAAALRGQPEVLAGLQAQGRVLPVWRGKPLFRAEGALGWVPADHKVLADAAPLVFLGLEEDGQASFAADLSNWEPESGSGAEQSFFDQSRQPHPALDASLAFEDLRNAMMRLSPRDADTWERLVSRFGQEAPHLFGLLGSPMKFRALAYFMFKTLRAKGFGGTLDMGRFLLQSPRQWLTQTFASPKVQAMGWEKSKSPAGTAGANVRRSAAARIIPP